MQSPKFESHLTQKIQQAARESSKSRYGIVLTFNRDNNTATIMLSSPDSDSAGDIHKDVPCPVIMGIQMVAPEPGRPCWVAFKGDRETYPVITHYFNHNFNNFDFKRHYTSSNGVPNYELYM